MDVSVSLARDSYHAFSLAMRALHVYPAKIYVQQPIAPVLSFLAPAAALRASSTLRRCNGGSRNSSTSASASASRASASRSSSTYLKPAKCRKYSTLPQYYPIPPPKPPPTSSTESHSGSTEGNDRDGRGTASGVEITDIPKTKNEQKLERRLRLRRLYARRYTGILDGTDDDLRSSGIFTLGKAISAHEMTVHLLSEGRGVKDIKRAWDKLDHWEKEFNLEEFMEWLVDTERFIIAARILEAVHLSFKPTEVGMSYSQIVLGNLELLRVPDEQYWARFRNRQAIRLYGLFKRFIIRPTPESPVVLAFINPQTYQFVAYQLARNLPPEDLPELYEFLNEHIQIRSLTLLHFIDRLAKEGDYLKGYEIIKVLIAKGHKITSDLCRKAFTLLLSKATRYSDEEASSGLLTNMFEAGLSADTAVYNVLIYNAIRNRKTESALEIYRRMLEEGLRPNPVTFAHMFHLHKRTGDVAAQRSVVENALKAEEALCAHMCCDIVHAAALAAPPGRKFPAALEAYQKLYLPGVPALLGIAPKTSQQVLGRRVLLPPNKDVTAVLVGAFAQDETEPLRVWELYRRYIAFKDTKMYNTFFGTQPVISNIFLKFFGSSVRTLDMALEVMNELLAPQAARWRLKIGPNQASWSILAKAFSSHGRMQQAEAIVAVMRQQNYAVTEVTWLSLMKGYLSTDNPEEAGATLGRMLEESVGVTGRTISLVAKLESEGQFRKGLDRVASQEVQELAIPGVFKPRPVRLYPQVSGAVGGGLEAERGGQQAQVQGEEGKAEWWEQSSREANERREFAAMLARKKAEAEVEKALQAYKNGTSIEEVSTGGEDTLVKPSPIDI